MIIMKDSNINLDRQTTSEMIAVVYNCSHCKHYDQSQFWLSLKFIEREDNSYGWSSNFNNKHNVSNRIQFTLAIVGAMAFYW